MIRRERYEKIDEVTGRRQSWCELSCDQCHNVFEKRRAGYTPEKSPHHFCCNECIARARSSGILAHVPLMASKACYVDDVVRQRVLEKRRQTSLAHYGVDHPFQAAEVREKSKVTWLKRYGVSNPASSPVIKAKIDQQALHAKGHATRKANGTYARSKIEDRFYVELCTYFGCDNVERQARVNNWSIDFYVKSIDTYIQFDGVHWHGLDRPIEEIKESNAAVDRVIASTNDRDIKQNAWFAANDMRLVRITDMQFKHDHTIAHVTLDRREEIHDE